MNENLINAVASLLTAIASIANLLIVLAFYVNDKKQRKLMDDQQKTYNSLSFWYHDIALTNSTHLINDYFLGLVEIAKEAMYVYRKSGTDAEYRALINRCNENSKGLKDCFVPLLRAIDRDFGNIVNRQIENVQDYILNYIDNVAHGRTDIPDANKVLEKKTELLVVLYRYEKDGFRACSESNLR